MTKRKEKESAKAKPAKMEKRTIKEHLTKVKTELKGCEKKISTLIKKSPEKAALISAAVIAALGAGITSAKKYRRR